MRLLLDTHVLLWWLEDLPQLSAKARQAITDAEEVYVSAVSALEVTTKVRIGKLPGAAYLAEDFLRGIRGQGFILLAVTVGHAAEAGRLAFDHKDPFDRILIAQSLNEEITLVSNERIFDATGVSRLW